MRGMKAGYLATLMLLLFLGFSKVLSVVNAATGSPAQNSVKPGELLVEPSTLICLGFEWYIGGDDNRNAAVKISYRKKGDSTWKEGLPLLRLFREETIFQPPAFNFVAPNMFAGSLFDLEPDTEYECRFIMSDPDGVTGNREKTIIARTRAEPKPFSGGRVFHVYPRDYKGQKQEPAFTGLLAAYNAGSSGADHFNTFPPRVEPGDTILVHAGVYKDENRYRYGGASLAAPFDGTYYLTRSGTPGKPISIQAAGDGEVIFDGSGCFNLFNVMAANYTYFEGLTIRNTEIAFWAGIKGIAGSEGLTVKRCRLENVGRGIHTDYSGSKNFYIADNVFIGRHDPDRLLGWSGEIWKGFSGFPALITSEYAIKIYGSGHVVCYNYVANFHDGIDHATYGNPDGWPDTKRDRMPVSIDFYNNDISNIADNCIEADGAMYNIRVLRNRCVNTASMVLSTQPVFGGPAYFIRNIVYHAPRGGSLKFYGRSSGEIVYHNTLASEVSLWSLVPGGKQADANNTEPAANVHFRNNLILGEGAAKEIFFMDTSTNYSSSDYNGFRPNEGSDPQFAWSSPPFNILADYTGKRELRKFMTLAEYSQAIGQDKHSILIDWDIFQKVRKPDSNDPQKLYKSEELDFALRPGASPVDAGCRLPNVNDGFTGKAPDLGAVEVGQPVPHYGPRS
jgi:hypothetical protein